MRLLSAKTGASCLSVMDTACRVPNDWLRETCAKIEYCFALNGVLVWIAKNVCSL